MLGARPVRIWIPRAPLARNQPCSHVLLGATSPQAPHREDGSDPCSVMVDRSGRRALPALEASVLPERNVAEFSRRISAGDDGIDALLDAPF